MTLYAIIKAEKHKEKEPKPRVRFRFLLAEEEGFVRSTPCDQTAYLGKLLPTCRILILYRD